MFLFQKPTINGFPFKEWRKGEEKEEEEEEFRGFCRSLKETNVLGRKKPFYEKKKLIFIFSKRRTFASNG